jgi:hypothetical protein
MYENFEILEMCLKNLPLSPIHEGSYVDIVTPYYTETKLEPLCEPKPGAYLYGVASKYVLNLQLNCPHSCKNTARNRCTLDLKTIYGVSIDDEMRREFSDFIKSNYQNVFGSNEYMSIMDFEKWLKRFSGPKLASKEKAIINAHLLGALDSIKNYKGIYKRKMFMKRELIAKLVLRKFQPRLVTGATDETNVLWGNYVYTFAKVFSYIFGGPNTDYAFGQQKQRMFVYASGLNRQQLGQKLSDYLDKFPGEKLYIESDETRYDSHQDAFFLGLLHDCMVKMLGSDIWVRKIMQSRLDGIRGYLPNGVKVRRPNGTRGSGDQDTTIGNSWLEIFKVAFIMYKTTGKNPFIHEIDALFYVLGDDNYGIGDKNLMLKYYKTADIINKALGFTTKTELTDKYHATFCSSLFLNNNNNESTLSPLPGKLISRTFYNLKSRMKIIKRLAYMKIIIQGLYFDLHWCRGVRHIFNKLLDLVEFVDETKYLEQFEKWKHSTKSIVISRNEFLRGEIPFEYNDNLYYELLYIRYGIDKELEDDFIKCYNPEYPFHIVDHEYVNRLVLVDGYGLSEDKLNEALLDDSLLSSDAYFCS